MGSRLFEDINEYNVISHKLSPRERVPLLERIITLADNSNREDIAFQARLTLNREANSAGLKHKVLVSLAWCLSYMDRTTPGDPDQDVLWHYKWVVSDLGQHPDISRQRIEEAIADIARRYKATGYGMRAVHKLRAELAIDMGRLDDAKRETEIWRSLKRDGMSDCRACELDEQVELAGVSKDYDRAVKLAAPILKGRLSCAEVPTLTHAILLLPLLRLRRIDDAQALHKRRIAKLIREKNLTLAASRHLQYLALTGQHDRARRVIEAYTPVVDEPGKMLDKLHFLLAFRLYLRRAKKEGMTTLDTQLPKQFTRKTTSKAHPIEPLLRSTLASARHLAKRFDERNNNDYYAQIISSNEALSDEFISIDD